MRERGVDETAARRILPLMPKLTRTTDGVSFRCPGCGDVHAVPTTGPSAWSWNGSLESPTLQPSLAVTSGHHASSWQLGDACWCGKDYGFSCYRCHSIVTDGRVHFCADSSHALAGQTVDLPEAE